MNTMRKTITLTDQQDQWIKTRISSGHYTNDSEYIRDLIRQDQARINDIDTLRAQLIEGEKSGKPEHFDGDLFKQEMITKHANKET